MVPGAYIRSTAIFSFNPAAPMILHGGFRRQGDGGGFGGRLGLAGEEGFVHCQVGGGEQVEIGRHPIARLDQHHITWHEVLGAALLHPPIAPHAGVDGEQGAQGRGALFGPILLIGAEDGIDQDHGEDERGVLDIADEQRDDRGGQQNVNQGAEELPQEDLPEGRGGAGGKLVRAIVGQATLRLGAGETLGAAVPCLERLVGRKGVPERAARGKDGVSHVWIGGMQGQGTCFLSVADERSA